MPKYILIGLGVVLILFFSMHFWSKLSDKTKNRLITAIFLLIATTFIIVLGLLLF